jgi:molybdopterin synthase sulfur carrier subunit
MLVARWRNSSLALTRNFFEDNQTMAVKVRIPTPLRKLTNDAELVEVQAKTIGDAIGELQGLYPGIKDRLVDETGAVRRFVNVYVNEEDIRFLQNQETPLKDGDEISIIPAIAGG